MKLKYADYEFIFTPEVNELLKVFYYHNHEIRLAGGAVRDILLGKEPDDLDFATTATPKEMKKMFASENIRVINSTGEKHGTVTVRMNDKENFEITTLRMDVDNDGRHANVVFITDWELDANRRDLTINSLFLGIDGTVFDYCGGREDLIKRKVKFVGDASKRMQEDYLRILRYFRFCARISEDPRKHDLDMEDAIEKNIAGLAGVSGERIWIELKKILSTEHAGPLLETMLRLGIGPHIGLPDDLDMEEFKSVWERTSSKEIWLQPVSLLTSLLKTKNPRIKTEEDAMGLSQRLKLTNYEKELSLFIVRNRNCKQNSLKPLRPYHMMVIDYKNKIEDGKAWAIELLRYEGKGELADEFEKWIPPKFPVSGNDLKAEGVPSGKGMGSVIQRLRIRWEESNFEWTEKELISIIPDILRDLNLKPQIERGQRAVTDSKKLRYDVIKKQICKN